MEVNQMPYFRFQTVPQFTFLTTALLASIVFLSIPVRAETPESTILYVTTSLGIPYFQEQLKGVNDAASRIPHVAVDARAGKSFDDVVGQQQIIDSFIARQATGSGFHLTGVILVPSESGGALAKTIKSLNDNHIPIINIDIELQPDSLAKAGAHTDAFIGSNNIEGGRLAADILVKESPHDGHFLLLNGVIGQQAAVDRRKGFLDRLAEVKQQTGYTYTVREWNANWSQPLALAATSSVLNSGYQLDGIFAEADPMALGAIRAIEVSGTKLHPAIVGFDAVPEGRNAVETCKMTATISQNPEQMGEKAVAALALLSEGKSPPEREYVELHVIRNEHCPR
jgi:ribose transport system substrate-binding protein